MIDKPQALSLSFPMRTIAVVTSQTVGLDMRANSIKTEAQPAWHPTVASLWRPLLCSTRNVLLIPAKGNIWENANAVEERQLQDSYQSDNYYGHPMELHRSLRCGRLRRVSPKVLLRKPSAGTDQDVNALIGYGWNRIPDRTVSSIFVWEVKRCSQALRRIRGSQRRQPSRRFPVVFPAFASVTHVSYAFNRSPCPLSIRDDVNPSDPIASWVQQEVASPQYAAPVPDRQGGSLCVA